jgi:RNA polymerase sigma-70 factor (ECF subfamily)
MSDASDAELVLQTRGGEIQAFGELVRRYQESVFNVCYRLAGERREAEDLTQEAFLRAFRRLDSFDETRPFGPWMRRLAANLSLNALQRRVPVELPLEEEHEWIPGHGGGMPEPQAVQRERTAAVRQAIQGLPPHFRAVIELRHYQGLSYAEIAEALSLPLSDVKSHLYRARKHLAQVLEPDV